MGISRLGFILFISVLSYSCHSIKKDYICTIKIEIDSVLFSTSSYVIGTCRNHISNIPNTNYGSPEYHVGKSQNIEKELQSYRNIQPKFSFQKKLYRLGHGPVDGRLDSPHHFMKGYHFEDWWNKTAYPYDDLRYGLREAVFLNADVSMPVNYGTGTPEEAGRLVSYLNNKNDSLRQSQSEEPWNIQYFELGNEVSWRSQRGHDPFCLSASGYATRAKEFAAQMRKNSDIPLKIGLVASINASFINDDWSNNESNNYMYDIDTLIQIMLDDIDFLVFHNYPSLGNQPEQIMAQNTWLQNKINDKISPTIRSAVRKYGLSHPVRLANSEYNTNRYGIVKKPDVLEALYAVDNIITAIRNEMEMAVSFCFVSHGFQGMMFYNNDTLTPTPVYQLQKLLAEHMGDSVLFCSASNIPQKLVHNLNTTQETENNTMTSLGNSDSIVMNQLDFVCTKTKNGKIILMILNRTEEIQEFIIERQGLEEYKYASVHLLKGEKYLSENFLYDQQQYQIGQEITIAGASVAIIEIF